MQRVFDRVEFGVGLAISPAQCCLPPRTTASTPQNGYLAAQYLACSHPCQRFDPALTDDAA